MSRAFAIIAIITVASIMPAGSKAFFAQQGGFYCENITLQKSSDIFAAATTNGKGNFGISLDCLNANNNVTGCENSCYNGVYCGFVKSSSGYYTQKFYSIVKGTHQICLWSDSYSSYSGNLKIEKLNYSYCGDGICDASINETCLSCPFDCGFCTTNAYGIKNFEISNSSASISNEKTVNINLGNGYKGGVIKVSAYNANEFSSADIVAKVNNESVIIASNIEPQTVFEAQAEINESMLQSGINTIKLFVSGNSENSWINGTIKLYYNKNPPEKYNESSFYAQQNKTIKIISDEQSNFSSQKIIGIFVPYGTKIINSTITGFANHSSGFPEQIYTGFDFEKLKIGTAYQNSGYFNKSTGNALHEGLNFVSVLSYGINSNSSITASIEISFSGSAPFALNYSNPYFNVHKDFYSILPGYSTEIAKIKVQQVIISFEQLDSQLKNIEYEIKNLNNSSPQYKNLELISGEIENELNYDLKNTQSILGLSNPFLELENLKADAIDIRSSLNDFASKLFEVFS